MIFLDMPEYFPTERTVLRRLRYEDAEEIFYTYAGKAEATRFMSWPTHQHIDDTRSFLNYAVAAWEQGLDYSYSIRLKDNNKLMGSFGAMNENGKIQFGYILSPTFWRMGYATEVCRAMMDVLKRQKGVYRIGTFVDLDNTQSIHVLDKCGLKEETRLRQWMRFPNQENRPKDCGLYVLPLTEPAAG